MNDGPNQNLPAQNGHKILFLFLTLAPLPIGFLLNPLRMVDMALRGISPKPESFIIFNAFALICCIIGTIGMCGGFKKAAWIPRIGGIVFGFTLWIVEALIIFFIGCCQGLGHIGS